MYEVLVFLDFVLQSNETGNAYIVVKVDAHWEEHGESLYDTPVLCSIVEASHGECGAY